MLNITAIYPGTFDPITLGHLDIVRRATRLFDTLIVAVAQSSGKNPLLQLDERLRLTQASIAAEAIQNVRVESFSGLLVDYAAQVNAQVIVRGLRAVSDFDYEMQLSGLNREMAPTLDTVFVAASHEYQFLSSTMVREICRLGGPVERFVHPIVATDLAKLTIQPGN